MTTTTPTPGEWAAMRQAAINYRVRQEKEREKMRDIIAKYMPVAAPKPSEAERRKAERAAAQTLIDYRMANGEYPPSFNPKDFGFAAYTSKSKLITRMMRESGMKFPDVSAKEKQAKLKRIREDRIKRAKAEKCAARTATVT